MENLKLHEIPGRVTVVRGTGGLPALRIETDTSIAEIHPYGAHVTGFQKKGEAPLLFRSAASEFLPGKPIRGGVPVIYPWFGGREGLPAHGTARICDWELTESMCLPDGSVRVCFLLPDNTPVETRLVVTVGNTLTMELRHTNNGEADSTFEHCLHTYFQIGDIHRIEVSGLKGSTYLDNLTATEHLETGDTIRFAGETDRVYQNTAATVEILDPVLGRGIAVRKSGSLSTVVWNPWIEKSQRMADFGDDEWPHMVCVESGNVKAHTITLAPGESASMTVDIESLPLV